MEQDNQNSNTDKMTYTIKDIQTCSDSKSEYQLITRYNVAVMGYHNYYKIATDVNLDLAKLGWKIDRIMIKEALMSCRAISTAIFAVEL